MPRPLAYCLMHFYFFNLSYKSTFFTHYFWGKKHAQFPPIWETFTSAFPELTWNCSYLLCTVCNDGHKFAKSFHPSKHFIRLIISFRFETIINIDRFNRPPSVICWKRSNGNDPRLFKYSIKEQWNRFVYPTWKIERTINGLNFFYLVDCG
jgi:hypothetical protein